MHRWFPKPIFCLWLTARVMSQYLQAPVYMACCHVLMVQKYVGISLGTHSPSGQSRCKHMASVLRARVEWNNHPGERAKQYLVHCYVHAEAVDEFRRWRDQWPKEVWEGGMSFLMIISVLVLLSLCTKLEVELLFASSNKFWILVQLLETSCSFCFVLQRSVPSSLSVPFGVTKYVLHSIGARTLLSAVTPKCWTNNLFVLIYILLFPVVCTVLKI